MKIVVADKMADAAISALKELGEVAYLPSDLLGEVKDADILVVRSATKVTADIIKNAQNLRIVGRAGVGIDNIDKDACDKRGIMVVNTPDAPTISVAELTIGVIICALRNVGKAHYTMRNRKWAKKELRGREITGKTLGIIGFGRVGKAVGERAHALGMSVISNTPGPEKSAFARFVDLDALLKESDVITIHAPLNPSTKNMINKEAIQKMKDGVYLINLARGGIVDEDALYDACKSGKIAGAALDVYPAEPYSGRLLELDNILFTPHIASSTKEAQMRVGEHLVRQLKELIEKGVD